MWPESALEITISADISLPSDNLTPETFPAEVIISSTCVLSLNSFPCSTITLDIALAIDTDPPMA